MFISEDMQSALNSHIHDIRDRLYAKNGGANLDYANFCIDSDFDWLEEEVKNEFDNFYENFIDIYAHEVDMEDEELEEELLNNKAISNFISEKRQEIMNQINELRDSCGTHKIYNYIKNQIENRFDKPAQAFEKLEEELIKKGVVEDLEELQSIDSYIKAKRDFK